MQVKTTLKQWITQNQFVRNYKRMWPFVKPYWGRAVLGVLLTIPVGSLDAVIAMFLKPFMDNVMVEKQPRFSMAIPFLIVGFTIVQGVLNYASNYMNTWVGNKITLDIRKKLFAKLMSLNTAFFDDTDSGFVMMRFNNDADTACNGLINHVRLIISKVFSSLALVCVLFYNSWQLTIIAVTAVLVAFVPIYIVRRKMEELVRGTVQVGAVAMKAYNEAFSGNRTIAAYNLQKEQQHSFNDLMGRIFSLNMGIVKHTGWLSPVMHFIISLGLAFVIWQSSSLIVQGTSTSGNFTSFVAALLLLYTPLKTVGDDYVDIKKALLAIERIFEIFALKPTIKDTKNAKTLTGLNKEIKFENVSFAYKEGVDVLKDINLTVPVGSTLALVGNSGGGKSTLVNLLPRFYDVTRGRITFDGQDIRDFTLASLRDQIAVVFQDNFLFSGTIRDNILIGRRGATEEDLRHAVENAHLEEFIATLKDGLDTELGERGMTLSGGQRQRVAIARAFIRNAPVVVLDEATSALDNKSEAIVQKALDNLMKNRTVFVIAHRLSTVVNADKIVVLNGGEIVEAGTHEELLALEDGAYKALYNAQFKYRK